MNYFVSVSGGLDSTALSILVSKKIPDARYIFADTGDEFPQVYNHLTKMEERLNIKIETAWNDKKLGEYEIESKYFPSHKQRFCTRMFKIEPIERYLKVYEPFKLAIGLRADEDRKGNIADYAVYPLQEWGIKKCDVVTICQQYDLIPKYPWYMSRGGCYSCFYKSKEELIALAQNEPKLFDVLIDREELVQDKRQGYYPMFHALQKDKRMYIPLRKVKEIAQNQKQIEMFDRPQIYENEDCGIYCRK